MKTASRLMDLNAARAAAAAYSNQLFASDSGLNEDIGNFDAADCHCYPCEASPDDLKGTEMTTLGEKMKSQQAQLAKLTTVAARISAEQKKKQEQKKKGRNANRRRARSAQMGGDQFDEDMMEDDAEMMDDDLEDENSLGRETML